MHPVADPERRRLMDKLIREIFRAEVQATEHAPREAKRIGETPPVQALRDVGDHAAAMRPRFAQVIERHDVAITRTGIGATLASLRHLVVDRVIDPERAFRTAVLDLRHGLDVVKLLRELARSEELFGVIRWCDDWLGARRALVARVEAQLVWFVEQAGLEIGIPPAPAPSATPFDSGDTEPFERVSDPGRPANLIELRSHQRPTGTTRKTQHQNIDWCCFHRDRFCRARRVNPDGEVTWSHAPGRALFLSAIRTLPRA
jgi:hypothetical protein